MRSLPYKAAVIIILTAMAVLLPRIAYADAEMFGTDLTLGGEDVYNDAVEKSLEGRLSLHAPSVINSVLDKALGEIRECAGDMMILFIIAAISGVITNVSKSTGNSGAGEAAFFACFTLMSAAAVRCFAHALDYGVEVMGVMTDFVTKLSPLLMLSVAASGGAASAAAFSPVLSGAVYVVSIIVDKCLVPLCAFGAVLSVAGNISEQAQLSLFYKVVKSSAKWIMAAVMTVFTAISTVYGFSSSALDAVGGKAVKFAVGSLVPVVGGFLSDTMETVISGTRLAKNSVGAAGMIAIFAICAVPVIKIGVIQLMLKLTSAIAQPLTDKRISQMMWDVSEAVTTVFALIAMTAVMFVINLCIIVAATTY